MNTKDQVDDLEKRVVKFNQLKLPGQPQAMHMGTSYLVNDLWDEVKRLRDLPPSAREFDGTDKPLPSPPKRRCLRCNQSVYTDAPTILCDGVVSKVVPFSTHEPMISAPHASAAWEVVE